MLRDLESSRELDINTCYAALSGTAKHVGTSFFQPKHVEETLRMLHLIAGGEDKWRARPFVSMSTCFVVPPLKFAEDACRCLEAAVRGGMPILLLAAGQAGATSPAALAGAVAQEVAEVLAGLVLRQPDLARPPLRVRLLAFRFRPAHRGDEWWQRRAGDPQCGPVPRWRSSTICPAACPRA